MKKILFLIILLLVSCTPGQAVPLKPTLQVFPTITPVQLEVPATAVQVPVDPPTSTPVPNDPYWPYTIPYLRSRPYGGGTVDTVEVMEETAAFTRYLIRYPSDGLTIYGFMDVPKGDGPFPVVIALHGLVLPEDYETLDYTTTLADMFAQNGYLVLHPNMRGYPPSDNGDNLFQVGVAVDVLNLIALVKEQGGRAGALEQADSALIGLWGHSLGGGVVLRVLTVSSDVKAAILYASTSGDETRNSKLYYALTNDEIHQAELQVDQESLQRISPQNYYSNISAAVKLYHGSDDEVIPVRWAVDTCDALKMALVNVDCVYYIGGKHTFFSRFQPEFNNSMMAFYQTYLIP